MSTQTTLPNERSDKDEATTGVIKELLLELVDPIKNYGYLFFLTITGILLNPRVVVQSIITPPAEQVKTRKGLLDKTTNWWKSSWVEKNIFFDYWFSIDGSKKYYNPISFLVAVLALQLALTSLLSIKEVPESKKYFSYMELGKGVLKSNAMYKLVDLGITSEQELNATVDSLDVQIKYNQRHIEHVEDLAKNDYLGKTMRLFVVIVTIFLFSCMMHKSYNILPSIDLFIYGTYIIAMLLMFMFWFNSIVAVMNDKYAFLSDIIFIVFAGILPICFYSFYVNKNFGLVKRAKKRWIALRYVLSLAIVAFSFRLLIALVDCLSEQLTLAFKAYLV